MSKGALSRKKNSGEFEEGYEACHNYVGKHRNHYQRGTKQADDWKQGWEARYYNDPSEEW